MKKNPITIGIDARLYGLKQKGLGRYVQKLLENLEKEDRVNKFVIFLRKENWDEYNPKNPNFKKVLADYRWYSLKEQFLMPGRIRRAKVDLMHFPHFNVSVFCFKPFVVTIHDLILKRFPTRRASTLGFFSYWFKNFVYQIIIFLTLKRAKKIIAISNYTKDDILRYFRVSPEKIEVIYEGGMIQQSKGSPSERNPRAAPSERHYRSNQRSDLGLLAAKRWRGQTLDLFLKFRISQPYLLYVGNAYPHKNLERLILAFDKLNKDCQKKLQLVLVGEIDYFYSRLQKNFSNVKGLVFTDFVLDGDLEVLYRGAALYIFPSMCEGFGLPPLEAMNYGTPVVSSNATCLPEVLGEAAVYFNPENTEEMAEKIKEVLEDEKIRQELTSKGYERIKRYSWEEMARETMRVYINQSLRIEKAAPSEGLPSD